jgi:hypothetical protein
MTDYTLGNVYGLAYYGGYIYAGTTNKQILKYSCSDMNTSSLFCTITAPGKSLTTMKVYGQTLYFILIDPNTPANGEIASINIPLTDQALAITPHTVVSGLTSPRSFCFYDGIFYITLANSIISCSLSPASRTRILGGSSEPRGIDTDGSHLYFCTYDETKIYRMTFSGTDKIEKNIGTSGNIDLRLYGYDIYVSSTASTGSIIKLQKTLAPNDIVTSTSFTSPSQMLFVNNDYYVSTTNKFVSKMVSVVFNNNFTKSITATDHFQYMLNGDFTIGDWTQVSFQSGQVTIDGNDKNITTDIANYNNALFSSSFNASGLFQIKNFNLLANTNHSLFFYGFLRVYGYATVEHCNLIVNGTIADICGGLTYNNDESFIAINITVKYSSVVSNGIGENAGSLLGYFSKGASANISDSFAYVLGDSTSDAPMSTTLKSASGAFVGSGVTGNVTIASCYCIFNGSMGEGSGILSGKFLGSSNAIQLTNFYAITNISYAPHAENLNTSAIPYFIGSYYGGSVFRSMECTNVNYLNLNINITDLPLYCNSTQRVMVYAGINLFTNYTDFNASNNNQSWNTKAVYFVNYVPPDSNNHYKCYTPTQNIKYDVSIGSVAQLLSTRVITFDQLEIIPYGTVDYVLNATCTPDTQINFSASNNVVTIYDINKLRSNSSGNTNITAYVSYSPPYSYNEAIQELTVAPNPNPDPIPNPQPFISFVDTPLNTLYSNVQKRKTQRRIKKIINKI